MIAYALIFGTVTWAFDYFWGDLAKHTVPLSKYLLGYFIKVLLFSFVMSLLFGKKAISNTKNHP